MNFVGGFMNNIPQFLMPGFSGGGMGMNVNINISSLFASGMPSCNQGISDQWVGNSSFLSSMPSSLMGFGGGMGMVPGFGGSCNPMGSMFGGMTQMLQQQQMMLMMMMMMQMQQQMSGQQFGLNGYASPNYSMPQFNMPSIPMQQALPYNQNNFPMSNMPTSPSSAGQASVDLARQFKGDLSYTLKGRLPGFQAAGGVNRNCADFVSSLLENTGQLKGHYVGVKKMEQALIQQGYRQIPREMAQPGDVWIAHDGSHTELISDQGAKHMIGSNNGGKNYQTITEVNYRSGKIYHRG